MTLTAVVHVVGHVYVCHRWCGGHGPRLRRGCYLLHATGSAMHNRSMRHWAQQCVYNALMIRRVRHLLATAPQSCCNNVRRGRCGFALSERALCPAIRADHSVKNKNKNNRAE
eukprot:COSAG01_NODE_2506_length_7552_cov_66.389776_4_plen_113_part_00